jgi:hypothetical protein
MKKKINWLTNFGPESLHTTQQKQPNWHEDTSIEAVQVDCSMVATIKSVHNIAHA